MLPHRAVCSHLQRGVALELDFPYRHDGVPVFVEEGEVLLSIDRDDLPVVNQVVGEVFVV